MEKAQFFYKLYLGIRPFLDRYAPVPRRLLFVLIFSAFFYALGGTPITYAIGISEGPVFLAYIKRQDIGFWATLIRVLTHSFPIIWRLLLSMAGSYLFCYALTIFIKNVTYRNALKPRTEILINQLIEKLGITNLYAPRTLEDPNAQEYAADIKLAIVNSKKVRMLTIAGYEWLGKGTDSLLFETLERHQNIDFECILLDDETGIQTINQRVTELHDRDRSIDGEKIKSDIKRTLNTITDLNKKREKPIRVRSCKWHPIFRILICDDVLFVSAYGKAAHGHEATICKIGARPLPTTNHDTWFKAFENFYESVKENSSPKN